MRRSNLGYGTGRDEGGGTREESINNPTKEYRCYP